ncbi:hypothetical protein VTN00DRAFT_3366 [Thermoascus crustaceus]|uniref:uncharacterized protein n=1 Tax=Thermoascus crustaceus TaxID=5088 RepID=UPI0037436812
MVPFKSLFCSIVSNTIAQGFVVGFDFGSRGASYASCILKSILQLVGTILTFYVFYRIIQNYTAQAADGSKKFNAFATVHQGILGILSAISVVEVLLDIISSVPSANRFSHFSHLFGYHGASTARSILYLLASLEIVCVTSLVVKLGASRSRLRTGAMFFIVGGFIFFVFNLSTAISTIRALRRAANLMFDVERTRTRHVLLIINAICTIGVQSQASSSLLCNRPNTNMILSGSTDLSLKSSSGTARRRLRPTWRGT